LKHAGVRVARYVLREFKEAMSFLAETPEAGHSREDLTDAAVKFWPVFSYMVVYDPGKRPLEIVRVLHGTRDIAAVLEND
jgi:toxin ParE1/3/4